MTEGFCRRGCSGRGTCVNQQCVCQDGWDGFDCSHPAYDDQCSRCVNSDPLTTSCYRDSCVCNPTNATCMCPPNTENQAQCIQGVIDYANSININTGDNTIIVSQDENNKGMSMETIIAIACGSVGGLLVIAGTFFGVRYVKRRRLAKKNSVEEIKPKVPKVPKLELQLNHTEDQSNQDSVELTRKAMSARSVHDSPLISHDSPPQRKIHGPSRFKAYSSQVHPEEHEGNQEIESPTKPMDSMNKFHEIEEPKEEEGVGSETNSPQLKSPSSKFQEPFEIKAQNYIVPDV